MLSPSGRMQRGRFAVVLIAVYVVSFASQALLSGGAIGRFGVWPFALVQAALIWVWYVAHSRRLHDARRGTGAAAGLALIYALAVVLVLLVMGIVSGSDGSNPALQDGASMLHLLVFVYLLGLFSDAAAGEFGLWLAIFVVLCLLPYVVSFGFSIWTGTRPSAPPSPAARPE